MSKVGGKSPGSRNLDGKVQPMEKKGHPGKKAEEQEGKNNVSKKKGEKDLRVVETLDSMVLNEANSENPGEGQEDNYCIACHMKFKDAQAYKVHTSVKKHIRNMKYYEQQEANLRTVYVSNLPRYISREHFHNLFAQFGQIKNFSQWPHCGKIEYVDKESVETLLSNPVCITHRFGGTTNVIVNRKEFTSQYDHRASKEAIEQNEISFECIREILERDIPFEEQLPLFIEKIRLSDEDMKNQYEYIATTLSEVFRPIFPNCKTYQFGSSLTGLGFKKCDLDLYLDIGEPINENENATYGWTQQRVFREAKSLMFRRWNMFSQIVLIPKAKTPIIKFCHTPTNIYCDITFKNGLGVRNSQLIKHYLTYDPRVKPIIIVIKYWIKNLMLSGTGKISHYAVTMLVLFYFQQQATRLVPTVSEVQQNLPDVLIHGWQTNFDEKHSFSNSNADSKSIKELLTGFFEFYETYDFASNVICPLDGLSHPKNSFKDATSLPESMHRYKENVLERGFPPLNFDRPMCLQDPIELNRNVLECCSHNLVEEFQNSCRVAAGICLELILCKQTSSSFLNTLFNSVPTKKKTKKDPVIQIWIPTSYGVGLAESTDSSDSSADTSDRKQLKLENWYQMVTNVVKDLLVKVFKFEVQIMSPDKEIKQQKLEVDSDVHTQNNDRIVWHCVGIEKVWFRRTSYKLHVDPNVSCLENEAKITNKVIEDNKRSAENSTGNPKIEVKCILERKLNPDHLRITIMNLNTTKSIFRDMANFARARIPGIIDKTLVFMAQHNDPEEIFR